MKKLEKYSLGIGDRFAQQGQAQLQAFMDARADGIDLTPVWNKSNREHLITGSQPADVAEEARHAVAGIGWTGAYHVDADHINLGNVDGFLGACDFYTLDVAEFVGRPADEDDIERFVADQVADSGTIAIPGLAAPLEMNPEFVRKTAEKFLWAMQEAGRIYRHVEAALGADAFITEVSVDETDSPQTPAELLLILAMIAREKIPAQTIAPKFTGSFNKGVDYFGDLARFEREFGEDLAVVRFAVEEFGLPGTLKLSVHSGSDKFSLYSVINRQINEAGAGLHVKTAGTTWLEEVIGLAEAGGEGLDVAKRIYAQAFPRFAELVEPYACVVRIDRGRLPQPDEVASWNSGQFQAALRHDQTNPAYNMHFRQFIHVSFRIAAELGSIYTDAIQAQEAIIGRNVRDNLLLRHIGPIFG